MISAMLADNADSRVEGRAYDAERRTNFTYRALPRPAFA
jgi:hypothetical protein